MAEGQERKNEVWEFLRMPLGGRRWLPQQQATTWPLALDHHCEQAPLLVPPFIPTLITPAIRITACELKYPHQEVSVM